MRITATQEKNIKEIENSTPPVAQKVNKKNVAILIKIFNAEQSPSSMTGKTNITVDNGSRKSQEHILEENIKKNSPKKTAQHYPTNSNGTHYEGPPLNQPVEEHPILIPVEAKIEPHHEKINGELVDATYDKSMPERYKSPEGSFNLFHTLNFLEERDLTD